MNLSKEQLTEERWASDRTLGRRWDHLRQEGIVEESMSLCLPSPDPPDFSIEYHLGKCRDRLNLWQTVRTGIKTKILSEFLSYHFLAK